VNASVKFILLISKAILLGLIILSSGTLRARRPIRS